MKLKLTFDSVLLGKNVLLFSDVNSFRFGIDNIVYLCLLSIIYYVDNTNEINGHVRTSNMK